MNQEQKREIYEILFLVALAVVIAILITQYVVQRTGVIGSSMEPTLHSGDQLVVNKFIYHVDTPKKGDIVVVFIPKEKRDTMDKSLYIKRVVANEGETVEVKDKTLYINDKPQNEPNVIKEGGYYYPLARIVVPAGHVFVMGDNRVDSRDSRELGPIPLKDIKGKAIYRIWPFNNFGKIYK